MLAIIWWFERFSCDGNGIYLIWERAKFVLIASWPAVIATTLAIALAVCAGILLSKPNYRRMAVSGAVIVGIIILAYFTVFGILELLNYINVPVEASSK